MSITDELREYAHECCARIDDDIHAIADRIDAEHEKALREAYTKGCEDGMGVANKADMRAEYLRGKNDGYDEGWDAGFASADDWCAQHEGEMAKLGWYRALDADKQPIKFGDEVEHNGVVAKVLGITFHGTTPPTVCIVRGDYWVEADELRHHHAPTVEDVLTEFGIDWEHERLMRERRGCIHYDQERHYCNVHDLTTEDYKRGYDDGFASADDWLAQHEDAMTEHGWIRLPKDADDVPWNVGDRDEDGNDVIALKLASDGWYVMTVGEWPYRSEHKRHHHAPTVEDVLREFAYGLGVPVADSYVAATAAKLRLAEGEDA